MNAHTVLFTFAVLLVSHGLCEPPTEAEIEEAILLAREIGILKAGLNLGSREATTARCPLSLAHGKRTTGTPELDRKVNDALLATKILLVQKGFSPEDLSHESVRKVFERVNGDTCDVATAPTPESCDFAHMKYRNADGSCNNKNHPEWGMAGRQQERVVPNAYSDGLGLPRTKGIDGTPLPNPRDISNIVNQNPSVNVTPSEHLTLHAMGFGQFLDHDIILTPEQAVVSDCCQGTESEDILDDNCFNVIISGETPDVSEIFTPGYCMEVKRSAPVLCPDATSNTPVRQQKSSITSFIDASNVYGSSQTAQNELREAGSGRLRTEGGVRPPNGNDADCTLTNAAQHCSLAGDARVNEVPSLTSYHYLFIKEHNRIADKIQEFYPNDNEKVFQETRRILIATMQHIVYDEFLPSFFSPGGLLAHNIPTGAYTYDANKNPTVFNGFGISYRLGHTWVSQFMVLFNNLFEPLLEVPGAIRPTEETFHNPDMTYMPNAFEELQFWLQGAPSPETDSVLEESVRSKLFLDTAANKAFDLASLNIQRGRDHGLPSYSTYRQWCGLSNVRSSWQPISQGDSGLRDHSKENIQKLMDAGYKSPKDIDLWIGGISEKPLPGGSIGPTFECIVGRMFNRLKFGDRFWFEGQDAGFTPAQRDAIKRYSFAKLLCNNFPFLTINHPNAFKLGDAKKECTDINGDLDLNAFRPPPPPPPPLERKQPKTKSLERQLQELIDALEEEDSWK